MTNISLTPAAPGAQVGVAAIAGSIPRVLNAVALVVPAVGVKAIPGTIAIISNPVILGVTAKVGVKAWTINNLTTAGVTAKAGASAPAGTVAAVVVAPYTRNLCPNGSFETGTSGWTSVLGTTLTRTSQDSIAGQYSLNAITLGAQLGEGFYGPQVYVSATTPGSISASFSGETGTIVVSAVANPGGVILEQQVIDLTPAWQRVTLNGLEFNYSNEVYILVQTSGSAQALNFLMDAVQYEPETPAHPYIDGSIPGCYWLGTPFASASVEQGQYSISFSGGMHLEGSINVDLMGEVFTAVPPAGLITSGGSVTAVTASPIGAFDDFALFEIGDPDPAMTYAGWNTAGLLSGNQTYARPWGIFYPPLDYKGSSGQLMWRRAAFMAMGLQFTGVPAGVSQNLTAAQVEMVPLAGPSGLDYTPAPQAFDTPRALHLIVKPARLNYATNPNFAVSTAGWTPFGGASVAQDPVHQYGVFGAWDGVAYEGGSESMAVTAGAITAGVALSVPQLVAGDLYTASVYVLPSAQMTDLRLLVSGAAGGVPGIDGVTPLLQLFPGAYPVAGWVRAVLTFTAPASTVTLAVAPVLPAAAAFPLTFNLACCLIEPGEVVGTYFDGSLGNPDYLWESTPGLSRSYYYPNYKAGEGVLGDILAAHTPMSISAASAVYLTPPTQ